MKLIYDYIIVYSFHKKVKLCRWKINLLDYISDLA